MAVICLLCNRLWRRVGTRRNARLAPSQTASPDRRLLFAAIVNCNAVFAGGNNVSNIPVESYGSFFVTRRCGYKQYRRA